MTRKSPCQGSHSKTRPPPRAPAAPVAPVQVAIARGLRSSGVTCMSSDKVAGMTRAAPSPVTTRPASTVTFGAAADDRQPAAKTPRPAIPRKLTILGLILDVLAACTHATDLVRVGNPDPGPLRP
jgi:hypothetical protein